MIVAPGTASAASVECKKRDESDGYEKEAARFWRALQFKLREKMVSARLNFAVKITADQFRLGDVDGVVKETLEALRSSASGKTTTAAGYCIDFSQLAAPGGSIRNEVLDLFPRGVYGTNHGRVHRDQIRPPRFAGDRFTERLEETTSNDLHHECRSVSAALLISGAQFRGCV